MTRVSEWVTTMNGILLGLMYIGQFADAYYIVGASALLPFLGILRARLIAAIVFTGIAVVLFIATAHFSYPVDRKYEGVQVLIY